MSEPVMGEPVVSVRGLGVDLGGRAVVREVDLEFGRGELVALLGPNGAGKTTLLRALLGLVPTRCGEVSMAGLPPRRCWRRVGYVPQRHDFAWDFPMSVEQVVMSGLTRQVGWLRWPGARHHKAVRQALRRVRMVEFAGRPVGQLSGGQRQRVLIARALAGGPSVLLLDEPFTGVDVPTQQLLLALLREATQEGTTVVMTTHDLSQALQVADRVCLVNRTVVADGDPETIRRSRAWRRAFAGPGGLSPVLGIDEELVLEETAC